jgi:coenzyme F420 hydrogenase subunit beta
MSEGGYTDISEVARAGLCTGCGTCVAMCPVDAVVMGIDRKKGIYLPRLDHKKCTGCGICIEVCPGHAVDFDGLNREIFGKVPEDALLGNYTGCYTGHAVDENIRYHSASGGIVSALLVFALEQGLINGALVTRMNRERPLEPQPFIARTREEILEAARSKYCPVPANVALKEILRAPEGERFAVVGLPCHVHGLRKAELVNKKLKERITLSLGLFCGRTSTFTGLSFILKKLKIKEHDVASLNFRGEGWPGGYSIVLQNGSRRFTPHGNAWLMWGIFFNPQRCKQCADGCADIADISCGDAWLPEFSHNESGESIIMRRSEVGKALLEKALEMGALEIKPCIRDDVVKSQTGMLYGKNRLSGTTKRRLVDNIAILYLKTLNIYRLPLFAQALERMPIQILKIHTWPLALTTRYFSLQVKRRNKPPTSVSDENSITL